jgi:hypothetical protein
MAPFPFTDLPGGDLIEQGLADLQAGVVSIPSLLVQVGSPKLQRVGFAVEVPLIGSGADLPEHRLYHLLAREGSDSAHGRYNSLLRRPVSFTRAVSVCGSKPIPQE